MWYADKPATWRRAETLLADGSQDSLRYAALELRTVLEALAYEKLQTYAARLPREVLDAWQPPRAIAALLEFEPLADQNFVVRVRQDGSNEPARQLGEHHTVTLTTLKDWYHRLGSYLHCPTVSQQERYRRDASHSVERLRSLIAEVVDGLRAPVASTFSMTMAETVSYSCAACDKITASNMAAVRQTQRSVCIHCSAAHHATINPDDSISLQLIATDFACIRCDHPMKVENRKLEVGVRVECGACGERHMIAGRQWSYGTFEEAGNNAS